MRARVLWVVAVLAAGMVIGPATANAGGNTHPVAPELPGPALSVDESMLDDALTCTDDLSGAAQDPVLLTPAFATDEQSFGWNYTRTLPQNGFPVCSLSLPDGGFGDLQVAAEYVVAAVRRMAATSERRVVLMGHQHGPIDEMWALKFWPDLPAMVSDVVSIATPWNGTDSARGGCDRSRECPPANWQIATGSAFLTALNNRPLPEGPSYTSIYTQFDQLIYPQPRASTLDGAENVALQDVCALRPVDHFSILGDNIAYRLVLDALNHDGPADPTRIAKTECLRTTMPGAAIFPDSFAAGIGTATGALTLGPQRAVAAEPPVADYAR